MVKDSINRNAGVWTRFWCFLKLAWIGVKWNLLELLTPHHKFDLKKIPRRPDEVAVITGGNRGIGIQVVKKLLQLHLHVVIGCRSVTSGEAAVEELRKKGVSTGSTEVIALDLTSLESVRQFATTVSTAYPRINILINNAGIMASPYKLTKDSFESQFQVNYLSHFLLTNILLPNLKKAGRQGKASRIVNVSSCAHYGGKINFEDIDLQKSFSSSMAYMSSKLLQVVSTKYLDNVLRLNGDYVKVYAVHPGVIKTDLYENIGIASMCGCCLTLLYKNAVQGADGVTFTAISTKFEDEGGLFFCNCKMNSVNKLAKDPQVQKKLWEVSCQLTGWTESLENNVKPNGSEGNRAVIVNEQRKPKKKISVMKDEASRPVPKGPVPDINVLPGTPASAFKVPLAVDSKDKKVILSDTETEDESVGAGEETRRERKRNIPSLQSSLIITQPQLDEKLNVAQIEEVSEEIVDSILSDALKDLQMTSPTLETSEEVTSSPISIQVNEPSDSDSDTIIGSDDDRGDMNSEIVNSSPIVNILSEDSAIEVPPVS